MIRKKKLFLFFVDFNKMVQVIEDEFGRTKQASSSETEIVKRFTFCNRNGVTVQVRLKIKHRNAAGRHNLLIIEFEIKAKSVSPV